LTVQADFEQAYDINLYNKIYSSLESLDISILVNNVGWDYIGGFLEQTEEFYRKLILINEVPQVILTKKVLPKLLKRTSKSAVISLSSIASVKPLPFFSVYSATKNFNKFFMLSVEKEYPQIDFLTVMPGYVSTQMTHNEKPVGDVLSKETAVKCYLNDLGVKNTTFGHWKHAVQGYFYGWVNETLYYFLYDNLVAKMMVERRRQAVEKEKKGK
jgi:short-subunit dehydrogenase